MHLNRFLTKSARQLFLIRDPVSEGQHLIDAIEAALSRYNENAVEVLEPLFMFFVLWHVLF